MNFLPDELIETIVAFLNYSSVQQFSITSKRMRRICQRRLWGAPRFTDAEPADVLKKLKKQNVVRVLHSGDFRYYNHKWLNQLSPPLEIFKIEARQYSSPLNTPPLNDILMYKPYLIIDVDALLPPRTQTGSIIKCGPIDEIAQHRLRQYVTQLETSQRYEINLVSSYRKWTVGALRILSRCRIGSFSTGCAYSREKHGLTKDVIDFILEVRPSSVRIEGMALNVTSEHLAQINKCGIKVTHICTESLNSIQIDEKIFPWSEIQNARGLQTLHLEFLDRVNILCLAKMRVNTISLRKPFNLVEFCNRGCFDPTVSEIDTDKIVFRSWGRHLNSIELSEVFQDLSKKMIVFQCTKNCFDIVGDLIVGF